MSHKSLTTTAPTFTIMMGVPAAGKSTVANKMFGEDQFIDCDAIKQSHPDYDPKDPQALHAWSKEIEAHMISDAFANPTGNVVYDTTGTNSDKVLNYLASATKAGYKAQVVFVTVPEAESLRRNSLRPRVVPEWVLREKFTQITEAAEIIRGQVDNFQTVDNSVVDESLVGC